MSSKAKPVLLKHKLRESYQKLVKIAVKQRLESVRFQKLCDEHYGIEWNLLPQLEDNDRIIDSIDYGTDSLLFAEFDKLVLAAIHEIVVAEGRRDE